MNPQLNICSRRCAAGPHAAHAGMIGFGHVLAALRAAAARLGAFLHVADLLAALGAGVAYLRARRAYRSVQRRAAQHEVGCGLTDLRAIDHQPQMLLLNVLAARAQAIRQHLQAGLVAFIAGIDAGLHLAALWRLVHHGVSPCN